MQSQSSSRVKMLAKVDGSGAIDYSVDPSTFGFPQDANQEFFNRALQYDYSVSRQGFEDKGFLPSLPDHVVNSTSSALGEYQQLDDFLRHLEPIESDGQRVQNNNGNIAHFSRASNTSCLDHVEDITSYDVDCRDDRAISFGSSCSTGIASYPYINLLQSNNCIADTEDGTWAALMQMQEALEASNEECSDLTFNNTELSGGSTMQHQVVWDNGCLTSPSFTSNFLPFPGEAEATVTNTRNICHLQNLVDMPHDNEQDISSFELKVPEPKGTTTSNVCERRDEMHSAQWGAYPGHNESSVLMPVAQDRQNSISHQQLSVSVNGVDGSVDNDMKKLHGIYECEEQMEIDSLLNSFGASSDTFSQAYEIFQKGETLSDVDKKVKLEESSSATCVSDTVSYTTQAGAAESALSNGSSCAQQYQSTSQSCGLFSSESQWKTMAGSAFPLWGCQNGVNEYNSLHTLETNHKDHLLYSGHTSVQQQQSESKTTKLELIDNAGSPYQEFTTGVDGPFCAKRGTVSLPVTPTAHIQVQLPAPSLSMESNSSLIGGTELKKVNQCHPDVQLPMTQTSHVQLPAQSFSKDPNSSSIEITELKKVEQHHPDTQLPITQISHVQLPSPSSSKDPNSALTGRTGLKKFQHHSDMQFSMTQTNHVQLPVPSLSKDPNSALIEGTELKKVEQHHLDMQLPMTHTSHAQLPAPSLSKDPNPAFIGGTKLKNVEQLDNYSHVGSDQQIILLSASKPSCSSGSPIKKFDDMVDSRPKKRKRPAANLLVQHAQVMSGCGSKPCKRTPELDLARATRTSVKKVDGENATMQHSTFISRAQERLVLTTSLIQHVLPVLPARLLASNVTNPSETIVYHISKLAVSDILDPVLSFGSDPNNFTRSEKMPPSETSTSGKEGSKILSEVLATFVTRYGKLESSLSRVEKALTFQDFAFELREIDRWSILNHLVKFGEYKTLQAGGCSNPGPDPSSTIIRKHVRVAATAPLCLPDGVRCRVLK
ncbi:hypothetical protein BRADI_1g08210v3 [Brachypodium distachyon]|uniref:Uncharacterized protein n=1 Tax=Brachypodium distachyon TaxID=15368 RepID=A0A0Q3RIY5_BRADI|nr:hypothetical protein BRADI_1g08210v3 [Brachypodium distachyon]